MPNLENKVQERRPSPLWICAAIASLGAAASLPFLPGRDGNEQSSSRPAADQIQVQAYEGRWPNGFFLSHYAMGEGIPLEHAQVHLAELNADRLDTNYLHPSLPLSIGGVEYNAVNNPRAYRDHIVMDYNNDGMIFGVPLDQFERRDAQISNLGNLYSNLER